MDYTLFRAYTKDAEFAANAQRANTHYQLFMVAITGKSQIDVISSPNFDSDAQRNQPLQQQQQRAG